MSQNPLLMLIDGHALVHRAFHALPPLAITRTGEPLGAVYGFASMLLKVLSELKPRYWAVAFDRPTPTFRHIRFEAYKAQRKEAPDELKVQFARVRQLADAFNLPIFEVDGYEADDILGTLCRQASAQGVDTVIVTGDADTMQLVSPHVRVLLPKAGRDFGDAILYDAEAVLQRYGVPPSRIADLKGLQGDASDNIPGVPGIGEKTAQRLLQQFDSLEGVYAHLDEVAPPRVADLLGAHPERARLSKELATITLEAPVELDLEAARFGAYQRDKVVALFRELEFHTLLGRLPQEEEPQLALPWEGLAPTVSKTEACPTDYRLVRSTPELEGLLAELATSGSFSVDLEATGKEARKADLVGLSFSAQAGRAYYIPVGHRTLDAGEQLPLAQVLDRLGPLLRDPARPKVAHNGKWDMTVLARYGVEINPLAFDTMIAAYLLGEKALGLKALSFDRLGLEMIPIGDLIGKGAKQITMAQVPVDQAGQYACADADMTLRLRDVLEPELRRREVWKLFSEVEMPLLPVLFLMEQNGVALDTAFLRELSQGLGKEMAALEAAIYNAVGHQFNINSSPQLGGVLFDELRLPRARRTKSGYSTDAEVLEDLKGAHPVIGLLLQYRQVAKLKSTYIDALPALIDPGTGRLHTSFNQTGTATGRLSSSDPNLQNIPIRTEEGRRVRRAFIAPEPSLLLSADYSQIDLRVLAHLSGDPVLTAAFARDEDIHAATASQVFGVPLTQVTPEMRRVAKTVNFGVIYGMGQFGLAQSTDLSREEAGRFIQAYFEKYSGVREYLEATKRQAREQGYVQTLLGRRRYIPEINVSNPQARAAAERMAINMPVQGTSADIIKVAMIDTQRQMEARGLKARMLLQVHDELVFEVPPEEMEEIKALVLQTMPRAVELSVPLKVDTKVGRNWAEME